VVENLMARGEPSALAGANENPVGVWVANYASKNVAIVNANVQGIRIGVASPFFYGQAAGSSREGSLTVENSYFRTAIGVNVATGYTDGVQGGSVSKKAIVRNSVFESVALGAAGPTAPEAISMNFGMTPQDARPRDPILVYDFNKQAGARRCGAVPRDGARHWRVGLRHRLTLSIGGLSSVLEVVQPDVERPVKKQGSEQWGGSRDPKSVIASVPAPEPQAEEGR
jgi:hypothetical protein